MGRGNVNEVLELQAQGHIPASVVALLVGLDGGDEYARLASLVQSLYGAMLVVSGGRVVVDTSKTPVEALVLSRVPVLIVA